ncbi:MAG: hypothetical protein Q8M29_02685 [Bacteroidota bacterium]|nr:hypothetical protein [Bacteroidota bacterium]
MFFTLLAWFSSCRKHGSGFVRGTVYEKGTNNPLPGVPIKITYSWHNNSGYYYQYDTTDANGEYKIDLKKKREYAYHIQAKNHVDDEYEGIDYKKSAINFSLYAEAYLKINAKKTSNSTNRLSVIVNGLSTSSSADSVPYEVILDVVVPWDQLPIVYKPHFL